jgi:transcriptional regulator with XRE-family HTH domain
MLAPMDGVRIGRVVRALRIRRAWRQVDLAARAGVSQSLIARVERGGADRLTVATLEAIASALGARLLVRIDWNGEAADRLLDADHAAIVELVIAILRRAGWEAVPEVSFAIDGERGSIDILAWHAPTATLLVVEVKSVVPDVQATLHVFDRKTRLAGRIGRERGWRAQRISSLLAVGEGRTARRRIEAHASTFDARFPHRAVEVRRYLANPAGATVLRGLWFLSVRTGAGSRQRVARGRQAS